MATSRISFETVVNAVRWVARSLATLIAGIVLLFAVTHFIGVLTGQAEGEGIQANDIPGMVAFFALWLGLVLGWKWEILGGLLTLSGLIAFYLLKYALFGNWPTDAAFIILASPSVLYLFCGWAGRVKRPHPRH